MKTRSPLAAAWRRLRNIFPASPVPFRWVLDPRELARQPAETRLVIGTARILVGTLPATKKGNAS